MQFTQTLNSAFKLRIVAMLFNHLNKHELKEAIYYFIVFVSQICHNFKCKQKMMKCPEPYENKLKKIEKLLNIKVLKI